MTVRFSEDQVHAHLFQRGLETLIVDAPELEQLIPDFGAVDPEPPSASAQVVAHPEPEFELWRLMKAKALEKLARLHRTVRYGHFIGSKVKLPIDNTRPMELDLLGHHEEGLFVLELKVHDSAERNAFSELFAYSNYIAGMFRLSGHKDITNVLVAKMDVKITRQAFLYDLLIADRNIIVYMPVFTGDALETLQLVAHVPTDDDFRDFTNELLSHESMACVVASFHDMPDWFDSEEDNGSLNTRTKDYLSRASSYAAQLMEAERLHGFCFVRKPWKEIPLYYRNSLIICALNPFRIALPERANAISEQLKEEDRSVFFEVPELGFDGRLLTLAKRAIKDCLTHNYDCELETPLWAGMVRSAQEVVFTHNFAFRPTGVLREAYTSYLNQIYELRERGFSDEDVSRLKIDEVYSWFRAWEFMEMCGFTEDRAEEDVDVEYDE